MGLSVTSLLFETVNFVALVWVLSRLVYRPLERAIKERRAADERVRQEAVAKRDEAARRLAELEARHEEVVELRERTMRDAAEDAARTRARLLGEAREDAASIRAQGEKLLASERRETMVAARELAIGQSTRIAARLLAELSPAGLDEALVEQLAVAIADQRGKARHEHGARRGRLEVDVRFAKAPRPEQVERIRAVVVKSVGGTPSLSWREDAALVAGAVATLGDRVLDASVAGNLDALAERARQLADEATVDG